MKSTAAALFLCLASLHGFATTTSNAAGLSPIEEQRKRELQQRLCAMKELDCGYVNAIFGDPRLTIYATPPAKSPEFPPLQREPERNPFLRTRFGLLTEESLERCRRFIQANTIAFDTAYRTYGVPREIICGILRIETDFGIPTRFTPNPVGTFPAVNRLVTLYVRPSPHVRSADRFARWQRFAMHELKDLLQAASRLGWDLFQIPGSRTGAIGLAQFEPSSLRVAVDGNGDGKIDLFDPADAIVSVANYLVTRGWNSEPRRQQRAVHAYYGGNFERDRDRFYMTAVLRYAYEVGLYLKDHPVMPETAANPKLQ
jgi:membrane-bound lytic murein transglycosylase B